MKTNNFTRQQYINNECTHREYYGQFVTEQTKSVVLSRYKKEQLKDAFNKNEHFNSIPLDAWDNLSSHLKAAPTGIGAKMKELGDYLTLSGLVCTLKEAAKQIIENN